MADLSLAGAMMIPFIMVVQIEHAMYMYDTYFKEILDSIVRGMDNNGNLPDKS